MLFFSFSFLYYSTEEEKNEIQLWKTWWWWNSPNFFRFSLGKKPQSAFLNRAGHGAEAESEANIEDVVHGARSQQSHNTQCPLTKKKYTQFWESGIQVQNNPPKHIFPQISILQWCITLSADMSRDHLYCITLIFS